jgi:YD repeat-containing protein
MSARPSIFDLKPVNRCAEKSAVYNDFGWPVKQTAPLGRAWTASHDKHGNVLSATDAKGQITVLTWDTGHQLASRSVKNADGTVHKTETFTRTPLGQPEKIVGSNPALTETRSYDAAHRLVSVKSQVSDASGGFPQGGRMSNWATRDQEVLIRDFIPADAITRIK